MSLTTRILLLVLLALAPALVIQGYNEHALRGARDEAVRADAMATARDVALQLTQLADGIRQALNLVGQDPSIRALDPVACTDYLRRAASEVPHVALLALTLPDGAVVCNSVGSPPGAYSNAGRTYHRRAMAEGTFVMGRYARGVATGTDSIHFAEPLRDAGNAIVGVLVAAVDLDRLSRHLRQSLRLPSTSLTLADDADTILVRHPDGADWIGKPVPPERRDLLATRGEGVRVDLGIDGRERVLANVRPAGAADRMWVTVGRDRDLAFADVDAATRRGIVLIVLGALLAVAAALLAGRAFIRRPFDRLLGTAAAWQRGDLAARTGLRGAAEFGRLGEKLDAMAASLQRHEADLRDEIRRGREMQERQVTMLHELNHRVKNTLATVQALARQSTRGGEAPGERLEARILALSKTHDLLTRDDWSGAPLHEVAEAELGPYRGGDCRIVLDGPEVALPPRHVLSLGMTLHELATNAARHGALCRAGGRLQVSWRVLQGDDGGRLLELDWIETVAVPLDRPSRKGFGTRLITASVERELDGTVRTDFAEAGMRCAIRVPLRDADAAYLSPLAPSARTGDPTLN